MNLTLFGLCCRGHLFTHSNNLRISNAQLLCNEVHTLALPPHFNDLLYLFIRHFGTTNLLTFCPCILHTITHSCCNKISLYLRY